jgi:transketolase
VLGHLRAQSDEYIESVLPVAPSQRVSRRQQYVLGEQWTTTGGVEIGIFRFGASAPGDSDAQEFSFTVDNVYERPQEACSEAETVNPSQALGAQPVP